MSFTTQPGASNGDTHQQRAADVNYQTISQHACGPNFGNYSLQNQGAPINISFSERSTPEEILGRHSWPEPPAASHGHAGFSDQPWSLNGACQRYGSRQMKANGSSSFAHVVAPVDYNPQYQCTASHVPPPSTSQPQPFQLLSFGQPTEIMDFQQQPPKERSPQKSGLGHTAANFGLLTPVSTYAQNSPSNEVGPGNVYSLGSESQQIWDGTFDAALETNQASDGLAIEMSNPLATLPNEQSWSEFDFESLNSLFAVNDPTTSDQFSGSFNPTLLRQDAHCSSHWAGHGPDHAPEPLFDTFLTDTNYPDPNFDRISSKADMAQRGLQPTFVGQEARQNTASVLPELVGAIDTPSRGESLAPNTARSSQKNDAKNALLIEWKEQGMSYKDIKAHGGFEEAESTLRGRYRTLTKPRQERVRRPVWSDRDVEILFAAVDHFTPANRRGQQHESNRGASERRRAEPKTPWKQVAEYMADQGCYKYGYSTVRRKYEEMKETRGTI